MAFSGRDMSNRLRCSMSSRSKGISPPTTCSGRSMDLSILNRSGRAPRTVLQWYRSTFELSRADDPDAAVRSIADNQRDEGLSDIPLGANLARPWDAVSRMDYPR